MFANISDGIRTSGTWYTHAMVVLDNVLGMGPQGIFIVRGNEATR